MSKYHFGPKMKICPFSIFCRKVSWLDKRIFFCNHWMSLEVLLYNFLKLQTPKLRNNLQELFFQAGKLISAESWKMTECHFWTNVMLRQPHVRATRAFPTQKGLRVVYAKIFPKATFFEVWEIHLFDRFLSYLPVKKLKKKRSVSTYIIIYLFI